MDNQYKLHNKSSLGIASFKTEKRLNQRDLKKLEIVEEFMLPYQQGILELDSKFNSGELKESNYKTKRSCEKEDLSFFEAIVWDLLNYSGGSVENKIKKFITSVHCKYNLNLKKDLTKLLEEFERINEINGK